MTDEEKQWLRGQFERCAPWLQAALDRDIGTHELPDVWELIEGGKAQLWPSAKSAVVTALEYFPRKTLLRYWLCGGEHNDGLDDCLSMQEMIENWAKRAGATVVGIGGRKGWLQKLPGFQINSVFMTKAL